MAGDDDKKLILARRARFVAAALAGVSIACGKEPTAPPQPCLEPAIDRDAAPAIDRDAEPMPCLTPLEPATPPDAGTTAKDAGLTMQSQPVDRQSSDAAAPRPCLSPPAPTKHPVPVPCLSVLKPKDQQK